MDGWYVRVTLGKLFIYQPENLSLLERGGEAERVSGLKFFPGVDDVLPNQEDKGVDEEGSPQSSE